SSDLYKNASFQLRNSFYGKVIDPDAFVGISRMHEASVTSDETYTGRLITDISFGLDLGNKISFTIGANNILDQYPSKNRRESTAGNQFVFSRRTSQFGYTGRFLFGKFLFHL
ncbi:MAG: TonB-dependent receptor, partial [Flavobacteriaceae bacterium]|nr:TonB-dependent receptor [Flavobacteriaceae bacterium]